MTLPSGRRLPSRGTLDGPWHRGGDALAARLAHGAGIKRVGDLGEDGDDAGPPGLVARAEAGAVVAVEILIERNAIAPVRVLLELFRAAEHRPPPRRIAQEDALQAIGDLGGHLEERHQPAGTGGTLH